MEDLIGLGKLSEKGIDAVSSFSKTVFGPAAAEVGELIADPIREYRQRRTLKVLANAQSRSAGHIVHRVPGRILFPLLAAASVEDDDELSDTWAALLAMAAT